MSTTYRYAIDADGTITRGQIMTSAHSDSWRDYWDGDGNVGFYEEYSRGRRPLNEDGDCERAISAYQSANNYGQDPHEALDTLAVRLTGNEEARFIVVPLDRGMDLYVLAHGGDSDNTWRDEIEAVYHGEIYRIESDKQIGSVNGYDPLWMESDYTGDEYYGLDNAEEELARQFPLTEYPAETQVTGSD